jgi:hypothetical protein
MTPAVVEQYVNFGVLGLTVLISLGLAGVLWREMKLKDKEIGRLNSLLYTEGKAATEALVKAIASVDRAVDLFNERVRD